MPPYFFFDCSFFRAEDFSTHWTKAKLESIAQVLESAVEGCLYVFLEGFFNFSLCLKGEATTHGEWPILLYLLVEDVLETEEESGFLLSICTEKQFSLVGAC